MDQSLTQLEKKTWEDYKNIVQTLVVNYATNPRPPRENASSPQTQTLMIKQRLLEKCI